jgi:hypothetical protein
LCCNKKKEEEEEEEEDEKTLDLTQQSTSYSCPGGQAA